MKCQHLIFVLFSLRHLSFYAVVFLENDGKTSFVIVFRSVSMNLVSPGNLMLILYLFSL